MTQHNHLRQLEAQSIYILREVFAEFCKPVLMYSIGKDSSVLLHLAKKAFYPGKLPFPILHVDTGWKFQEMIEFRNKIVEKDNLDLIVWQNKQGITDNINPFAHGANQYTKQMKTDALKQALNFHEFDGVIGGARRDEEKSRAKERIFSFRNQYHQWEPKEQRAELWDNFNTRINPSESIRVFPLSDWTELDIWSYIALEKIDIVPLYLAKKRNVIKRNNQYIMQDDTRLQPNANEKVECRMVRFRTLGCYPLTAAIESNATSLEEVINETQFSKYSERQGRLIDGEDSDTMEEKKKDGYF